MINGTGTGVNAGTIQVSDGAILYLGGTVNNTNKSAAGGIQLNSTGSSTEIRLTGPTTTFTGSGTVVLGTGTTNYIFGNSGASNTLVNVNNKFSGAGQLGNGSMTLVNQTAGIVNANQTTALVLNCNGGVTNGGLLEGTKSGGLFILNTTVDNTAGSNAGKITAAGTGARVDLQNSYFIGGTFTTTGTGVIDVVAGQAAYFDGSEPGAPVNIATGGNIAVNNGAILYLYGTINNAGTISIASTGNASEVRLVTPVVTLTGSGNVVLGTGGPTYIFGNGGALNELDNVNNTISGAGQLGNGQMALLNETAGIVNANQTSTLTLNCNGGVTNNGLLETTNTGGLFLLNTGIDNTQSANAGLITANGAGAHVDLQNTTIYGGTLTTTGTGAVIDVVGGQNAWFDGSYSGAPVNIATGSNVLINNNSALYLRGVINNVGTITLGVNGGANATEIRLNSTTVTLQGGGTLQLANSANNLIFANDSYQETLNNVDNIIQGSGDIGNGSMTLINGASGVIDANQQAGLAGSGMPGQLIIQVNGGVTNSGIIESTVGAGNTIAGDLFILNTSVDNSSGGKIEAIGKKALVDLQNSTIYGGQLISTTGGIIDVVSGQSANLDGRNSNGLTMSGIFDINNNAALYLYGSIVNKGRININAAANSTQLRINSPVVTLSGKGTIVMSNSLNNVIFANQNGDSLVNVDNTIRGAGNIGNGGSLALVNQTAGVINAIGGTLTIQTNLTVENTGVLESNTNTAGSGGLFILNTNIDNTGNSNAGKITATGTTGHVDLQNSNIYGGTLSATGAKDVIDVVSGQAAGLNGAVNGQAVNITTGSKFLVNNNSVLYLYGTITNAGTITLGSTGNTTDIRLNSSVVTLNGGGKIVMTANVNNRIIQNQGNAELNNVNDTISGSGQFGAGGQMYLVNGGTINANATGGMSINLGGFQTVNSGTLEASGSGSLSVTNGVFNTGNIFANGANVTIGGNIVGTGTETITGSVKLEIGSSAGGNANQAVTFTSGAGTFKIDSAQSFTGTLKGMQTGTTLDLANLSSSGATLSYSGTTTSGTLTVTNASQNIAAVIHLVGNYTQANFHMTGDGASGTNVTYSGTGTVVPNLHGFIDAVAAMSAQRSSPMSASQIGHLIAESAVLAASHL
jgi:hypothetical protein